MSSRKEQEAQQESLDPQKEVVEITESVHAIQGAIEMVLAMVSEFNTNPARPTMHTKQYAPLRVKQEALDTIKGTDLALESVADMPEDIMNHLKKLVAHLNMCHDVILKQEVTLKMLVENSESAVSRLLAYIMLNNNKQVHVKDALRFVKRGETADEEEEDVLRMCAQMAAELIGKEEADGALAM
jgi:hypothetical protein